MKKTHVLVSILSFFLIGIVLLGQIKWNEQVNNNQAKAKEVVKLIDKQEKEQRKKEYKSFSELYKMLLSGDVTKIKLIGDSITAGMDSTGYSIPDNNPVIFDDGNEKFKEASYKSRGWANYFRSYIGTHFPNVKFVNAGIGGKSTKWANENKKYWVSNNEDIVFVMLGTNDKWDSTDIEEYKANLDEFLSYVQSKSNLMIVMSPPPDLTDGKNSKFHFSSKDINEAVKEICKKNNYKFISNYEGIMSYTKINKAKLNEILWETSSHPNDKGYKILWENIKNKLTLKDSSTF